MIFEDFNICFDLYFFPDIKTQEERQCSAMLRSCAFTKILLPWKLNISVYLRVGVILLVRAGVCVSGCQSVWMCACSFARVTLLVHHKTLMRHIILYSVASLALPNGWHNLINSKIFWKVIEHKRCVLIFSTTFISNIFNSKKNSTRYCHKCENVFM
jgi:hypothetical protein